MSGVAVALFVVNVLLAAGVAASVIEETSGGVIHYQDDATVEGDAPDTCDALDLLRFVEVDAELATPGMLVPFDDTRDFFVLNVGGHVGDRIRYEFIAEETSPVEIESMIFLPRVVDAGGETRIECDRSVTDAGHPPEPGSEEKVIAVLAKSLDDYDDDPERWHFVINGVPDASLAPPSIHVVWSTGDSHDVPLTKITNGGAAMYDTVLNLGFTVHSASGVIFEAWEGEFNLGSGPASAEAGRMPVAGDGFIEFTVSRDAPHPILVNIPDDGGPTGGGLVLRFPGADGQLVIGGTCHLSGCRRVIELVNDVTGYDLTAKLIPDDGEAV